MTESASVTIGDRVRSRDDLLRNAARAATGLAARGVTEGSVVALLLRNDFTYLEASAAAGQLGAYITPINWHSAPVEVQYLLEDCKAKVLIAHTDLLAAVEHCLPPGLQVLSVRTPSDAVIKCKPTDFDHSRGDDWNNWLMDFEPNSAAPRPAPGAMIYTSGTTGKPKGVRRLPPRKEQEAGTMEMLLTLTGLHEYTSSPRDAVVLIPTPLYHATPNAWASAAMAVGTNLVVMSHFDAEGMLACIERHRVTHLLVVPTMFVRLLRLSEDRRKQYDVSSLRFVMHGAAPCPVHVKQAMIEWFGPVIAEHYGGTEVGAVTFCDTPQWRDHPGTVGYPLPHVRLAVLDDDGKELPCGRTGKIYCRNLLFPDFTYLGDDVKRASAELHGLISLGDVGFLDVDGFLHLCGRDSEIIISGGANIYPAEIEAELLKMPGVADCAVFGIPDEEFGERVCAAIQPVAGLVVTSERVVEFLRSRMASYKIPKVMEFALDLPREDTGKVFKRRLQEAFTSIYKLTQ